MDKIDLFDLENVLQLLDKGKYSTNQIIKLYNKKILLNNIYAFKNNKKINKHNKLIEVHSLFIDEIQRRSKECMMNF